MSKSLKTYKYKKTYNSTPSGYPVCIHDTCTMAEACLCHLAYMQINTTDRNYFRLVNPRQCSKDANCKFYHNSEPVAYARGFKNLQNNMLTSQYRDFMFKLIGRFGRTGYFERRRGIIALSPKEQQMILQVLREVGVTEDLKFDAYEENICWYD